MSTERTSLQRFQSLESDFDDLDEQLDELQNITQLGKSVANQSPGPKRLYKPRFHGREEWALGWLLRKLQAPGDSGRASRLSSKLWTTLDRLIEATPGPISAKSLAANNFLGGLEKTLLESFGKQTEDLVEHANLLNDGNSAQPLPTLPSDSNINGVESPRRSSKRKRKRDNKLPARSKKRESSPMQLWQASTPAVSIDALVELFVSVMHCLETVVSLSSRLEESISCNTSKFFRTNHGQAANILGSWLSAIPFVGPRAASRPEISGLISSGFTAVLRVWEGRSVLSLNDTQGTSISFANHCLTPAAILLTLDVPIIDKLEQLIAKHVFLPAKGVFQETSQQKNTKLEEELPSNSASLSKLIQPLQSLIESSNQGRSSNQASTSRSVRDSIPLLFSVAVRCTSLNSPKRRLAERTWLEHCFVELSSGLGVYLKTPISAKKAFEDPSQFTDMLSIARQNKLKFDNAITQTIALEYCGLTSSNEKYLNWTGIGHLIALDPNIFLGQTKYSRSQSKLAVDELLFSAISDHLLLSEKGMPDDRVSGCTNPEYKSVKFDVVMALIRAYSNARDTPGFLNQWHRGLKRFSGQAQHNQHASVWEDSDLHIALAEVLEPSMTLKQISEFVVERASDIKLSQGTATSSDQIQSASASAVLLTAILNAIRSDETKETILSTIGSLPRDVLRILRTRGSEHSHLRSRFWRLVASSHHFWTSIAEPSNFSNPSLHIQPLVEELSETIQAAHGSNEPGDGFDFYQTLEALACIGSILSDMKNRNVSSGHLGQISTALLSSFGHYFQKNPTQFVQLYSFGSTLARYPELLQLDTKITEDMREVKDSLLSQMAKSDITNINEQKAGYVASSDESPWARLIQRSIQDSTWLLDDIIKVIPTIDKKEITSRSSNPSQLKEISYLRISSTHFSRIERKTILRDLTEEIKQTGGSFQRPEWSSKFSVMLHMMTVVPGVAGLGIPFVDMLRIAEVLDKSSTAIESLGETKEDILSLFKDFIELSLRHDFQVAGQKQTEDVLLKMIEKTIEAEISAHPSVYRLAVLEILLDFLSTFQESSKSDRSSELIEMQTSLCSKLCDLISEICGHEAFNISKVTQIHRLTQLVAILAKIPSESLREHQFAVHSVSTVIEQVLEKSKKDTSQLAILNYKLAWKADAQGSEALELSTAYMLLENGLSAKAVALLQSFIVEAFAQLAEQERSDKLQDLLYECQTVDSVKSVSRWDILHMLVSASFKPHSKTRQDIIPASETSSVLITLSSHLSRASTIRTYHFISSSIISVLRHSSKSTTQPAIEATLLACTNVLSTTPATRTLIDPKNGAKIFTSLTTILRILLMQHRRRLRGRFHLLIPALQALLRRLFILPGSPRRSAWTLTATHAEAFTRLVTMLCDPSVSSAASSRHSRHNLTDETRKARIYAGQYVPALVLTLCDLQLHGRFVGEGIREVLAPGVYVMFDVMGKDMIGATNEGIGMPSGVRTVFRQWWEAWRRERKSQSTA